jgi:bifunctional ADP-heptose synthase (sugar kinase/adenylyltransferase)
MKTQEMRRALEEARTTFRAADNVANDLASILVGRLKSSNVSSTTLRQLKLELRNFNMQTYRWKE